MNSGITNFLSVDLEDWYQAFAFIEPSRWDRYEDRLKYSTENVLSLLDDTGRRATFFVLGYNAGKHPDLIKTIHAAGHEIGCHGLNHSFVYRQSPDEFREELRESLELLEGITGSKVTGFRAPWFSITGESLWALDILLEEGIEYDSSIFPMRAGYYGMNTGFRGVLNMKTPSGNFITEVQPSVLDFSLFKVPVTGGFYLRMLGSFLIGRGIKHLNSKGFPGLIYFHPWELDPEQPSIECPFRERIIHYGGLDGAETKLRNILEYLDFAPIAEVLGRGGYR